MFVMVHRWQCSRHLHDRYAVLGARNGWGGQCWTSSHTHCKWSHVMDTGYKNNRASHLKNDQHPVLPGGDIPGHLHSVPSPQGGDPRGPPMGPLSIKLPAHMKQWHTLTTIHQSSSDQAECSLQLTTNDRTYVMVSEVPYLPMVWQGGEDVRARKTDI